MARSSSPSEAGLEKATVDLGGILMSRLPFVARDIFLLLTPYRYVLLELSE